jgi:hemoglobin
MNTPTGPLRPAPPANPHWARVGGRAAVVRLVDAFYRAMDTRPEAATLRALHEPDLSHTQAVLVQYLCEWMGGPKDYSGQRGNPMLRRRHQPFAIDAAARDAWMGCMRQALAECIDDEGLRAELDAAFWKIADFIRNTEEGGATRAHPGRPMEVAPHATPATHASTAAAAGVPVSPAVPDSPPTRSST